MRGAGGGGARWDFHVSVKKRGNVQPFEPKLCLLPRLSDERMLNIIVFSYLFNLDWQPLIYLARCSLTMFFL